MWAMINQYVMNGLSILIIWMGPLSFLGSSGVIFHFHFIFSMKFMEANRIATDGTPTFAASHLRLFCLPMSHKKDARLTRVNSIHVFRKNIGYKFRLVLSYFKCHKLCENAHKTVYSKILKNHQNYFS